MKVVKKAVPEKPFPTTTATRDLTTYEKATSFVDEHGMIDPDEGIERVFRAAMEAEDGSFRVNWRVNRGRRSQFSTRSFPEAVYFSVRLIQEGHTPLLYAAIKNRDSLISARAYRDEKTKRYVSRNEAIADVYQRFLDIWSLHQYGVVGKPAPLLKALRNQTTTRKRERLHG